MHLQLHFCLTPPGELANAESSPDECFFGAHITGDIGRSSEGCRYVQNGIDNARNGIPYQGGGNATIIFMKANEVRIEPVWDWENDGGPIIYMSLDEYQRVINKWERFLKDRIEVWISVEIGENSVLL